MSCGGGRGMTPRYDAVTDGGENWEEMGLKDSERIARVVVNPTNSNHVYVAVLGHLWNANTERGFYRTIDGGKSWERTLYVDSTTGELGEMIGNVSTSVGPETVAFDPAGLYAFVTAEVANRIDVFAVHPVQLTLTLLDSFVGRGSPRARMAACP